MQSSLDNNNMKGSSDAQGGGSRTDSKEEGQHSTTTTGTPAQPQHRQPQQQSGEDEEGPSPARRPGATKEALSPPPSASAASVLAPASADPAPSIIKTAITATAAAAAAATTTTTGPKPFRMKLQTAKKHKRARKRKLANLSLSSSSSSSSGSSCSSGSEDSEGDESDDNQHELLLRSSPAASARARAAGPAQGSLTSSTSSTNSSSSVSSSTSSSTSSITNRGAHHRTNGGIGGFNTSPADAATKPGGGGTVIGTTAGGGGHSSNRNNNSSTTTATPNATIIGSRLQQQGGSSVASASASAAAASNSNKSNGSSNNNNQNNNESIQQPDGWRVKLYRLNADGSWDDCGTGRIVCLYRPPLPPSDNNNDQQQQQQQQQPQRPSFTSTQQQQQQQQRNNDNLQSCNNDENSNNSTQQQGTTPPTSSSSSSSPSPSPSPSLSANNNNNNNNSATGTDQWLYQETGEATLCVQAEVTKQNRQPRVLLRTRILLRDAYQRQGDNIITWCEPYYNPQQQQQHQQINAAAPPVNNNNKPGSSGNGSGNGEGTNGVDLALSFQDNAGCLDIWRQITHVQGRAAELLRRQQHQDTTNRGGGVGDDGNIQRVGGGGSSSVEDMAAQVAAQHHADLQRQQQDSLWSPSSSQQHLHSADDQHLLLRNSGCGGSGGSNDGSNDLYSNSLVETCSRSLPSPPTLQNLEDIADTIAALQHVQQRESLAMWIAKDECAYLKSLLALFPSAEVRGDYGKLATLAACVKTILLLNDPSILELIVSDAPIFEQICSCLEYDPDLREKANHRWFLRERAKFRTVVPMEDPDLVEAIHRSFRVSYLRDTLLRPTMDESSLSTLSSLQTFTYADVVKGVTMAGNEPDGNLFDSYLIKVIDMLCVELHSLAIAEWAELESLPVTAATTEQRNIRADPSIVIGKHSIGMTTWKQYLAPQDGSLSSRRMRRRGCLSFLKELFNMVRLSLQQNDKDDFFSVICSLAIDLNDAAGREIADNVSQASQTVEVGSVASTVKSDRLDEKAEVPHPVIDATSTPPPPTNLLSMLGCVLADPTTDVSEKGSVLEIIAGVVMHDPGLIRRHVLEYHAERKNRLATAKQQAGESNGKEISFRPEPNEKNQVIFWCPSNDLLASLLFLLDTETDAGVLLQVSEIMRIILDTDMVSDHGPMAAGFADVAEEAISPGGTSGQFQPHDKPSGVGGPPSSTGDQKQFLALFYEYYVEWLVAPFQFTILYPVRRVPDHLLLDASESPLLQRILTLFQKGIVPDLLKTAPACAVRYSFAVELLSFCVRAHLYRMKFFLLKSCVLGSVLKLLRQHPDGRGISGDRCLKLAALRFLRAILSVNDEFYHRHIIQHDLFGPVFEALRSNPVGDNLVSSAIVEMCDYIHSENVKSLIEYIVTRYLSASSQQHPENTVPSLEAVSGPYVSTLTVLRKTYEANLNAARKVQTTQLEGGMNDRECPTSPGDSSRYVHQARHLTGKALEDQRKFREVDEEESYFESDDINDGAANATATAEGGRSAISNATSSTVPHPAVDEVDARQGVIESELHRTPRMFSLAQAPLLNNLGDEENNSSNPTVGNKANSSVDERTENEAMSSG